MAVSALGTIPKDLEKRVEEQEKNQDNPVNSIVRSTKILRKVLGTWKGLLSLRERPPDNAGLKI